MRYPLLAMGLALGGCATGPTPVPEQPRPEVAVVRALDPGAVLVTECTGLPDELPWRAAAVLWHEALRQSVQFVVLEDAGG
ncbi:MAG: hypothetical protein KDC48_18990, partial [Planctomycetes bacterium]|nr:hypothetical protein [Planctomycetota bacterium]